MASFTIGRLERGKGGEASASAIRRMLDRVTRCEEPREAIVACLASLWDILRGNGVAGIGLVVLRHDGRRFELRELMRGGRRVDLSEKRELDWDVEAASTKDLWPKMQDGELLWGLTTEPGLLGPELRLLLAADGTAAIVYAPLVVGKATIGFIGASLGSSQPPTDEQIELIAILAGQAALALEREHLGERAKQQQLSLVRANDALRRSLESVSETGRLDSLLEALLLECVRVMGAAGGAISIWREGRFIGIRHIVEKSAIVPKEEWEAEPFVIETARLMELDPDGFARRLLESDFTRETLEWAQMHWPAAADYHRKRGHVEVWNFPCVSNGALVATLGLAFCEPRAEEPVLLGSMKALAHQTALLVEMSRLAEAAQALAAANVRAAEADRISQFLSCTIGDLSAEADVNLAVETIIAGLAREIGAAHVFLLRFEAETRMLRLDLSVVEGRIRRGPSGEEMPLFARSFDADITPAWRIMTATRGLFTPEMAPIPPEEFGWPGYKEYADRFGLTDVGHVVLFSGDKPIGSIGIGFRHGRRLRLIDKPFIEGVANQAAVALRMVDLAEQARQLAVSREREAAMRETADRATRVNQTIQSSIDGLNAERGARAAIVELMKAVAGVFAPLGVIEVLLSQFDPGTQVIRNLEFLQRGQLVAVRGTRFDGDWPVVDTALALPWTRIQTEEFLWGPISDHTLLVPEVLEYHQRQGARSVAHWPIRRKGQTSGWIGITLESEKAPTAEQVELTKILASSLSLAVEMDRLADHEKTLAIAAEREQAANARAAEARRISDFMSHTLGRMSEGADPRVTVESILSELAEELGAGLVQLFRHDAESCTITLEVSYVNGRIRRGPSGDEIALYAGPFADNITPAWERMKQQRGLFTPTLLGMSLAELVWPGVMEYAQRSQLSDMGHIVLFAGDLPVGSIGFALFEGRKIQPADKTFIEGVAKQAALAIRIADLAEQAKEAAVARERQRAVEAQASALANANASLRRVNERVARGSDLSAFVPHVLQELCRQTNSPLGVVFELESTGNRLRLVASVRAGEFLNVTPAFPWLSDGCVIGVDDDYWRALCQTRRVVQFEPGVSGPQPIAECAEWLRDNGIRTTLNFPMIVDETVIGFVGIGFYEDPNLDVVQVELAGSLAQQVALGIRLTRLAEEANRSGILEERNRIAREIHDTLAQSFTGILMQLQAAQSYSQRNPALSSECVERAQSLARDGLREARQSVGALSPSEMESDGLVLALERLAQECTAGTAAPCVVSVSGSNRPIPSQLASNLLLICREALSNAQRYAEATRIDLEIYLSSEQLRMRIADNGRGFDLSSVADAGFGLAGMRGRIERFGGSLNVVTAPGEGTRIELQVGLRTPRNAVGGGERK